MEGMITDIQRFSLNDGPGIRTVVFFKGCNLACTWCHNPEAIVSEPELLCYPQKCIRCGACASDENAPCFSGAHVWAGRLASVQDVMMEVLQDVDYYKTSGGGVTLSGGEAMMQPEFAAELLRACREAGVPAALETNLHYPFPRLGDILESLELVMCDLKLMNPDKHRACTGADNALILENIQRLARSGVPYILRTPVIPGVNDTEEEIGSIAAFAARSGQGLLYYELLNFNPLGASKYKAMGKENRHADASPLGAERMHELLDAAKRQGIPVRIG